MRAKEFITEKHQLNEFAPLALIPGIAAWLGSMSAVALIFHVINVGLSIMVANDLINEYQDKAAAWGPNPRTDWPEEEWEDLCDRAMWTGIGSVFAGIAPKVFSLVKNAFKSIPKEAKDQAMKEIAPKMETEFKKIIEKNKTSKSTPGGNPATKSTMGDKGINAPSAKDTAKATPSDIEKDRARIMGTEKPVDPKQAELKKKLQGQPETPQEKLKRELQAKQAAKEK